MLWTILAVSACAGHAPPRPAVTAGICPPPYLVERGGVVPRWLRVENELGYEVTVFVDRCFWHTRLTDVPEGRARQVKLPTPLVPFEEGLRFHVYDRAKEERSGVWVLPVQEEPVLTLVLRPGEDADPAALMLRDVPGSARAGRGEVTTWDAGGAAYAAVFADGSSAILSWSCGEGGAPYLTLSVPRALTAPVRVRVRVHTAAAGGEAHPGADGPEFRDAGVWTVAPAVEDSRVDSEALVAPEERVAELAAAAVGASNVELTFRDAEGATGALRFRLAGLGDALTSMRCFAGLSG